MTDAAVAGLVERGDPERWRTAMAAVPGASAGLMVLDAFNLGDRAGAVGGVGALAGGDPAALVA